MTWKSFKEGVYVSITDFEPYHHFFGWAFDGKDTRKISYYGELWKLKGFIHLLQVDRTGHAT